MSAFVVNAETIDAILTVYHATSSASAAFDHEVARDADREGRTADASAIRDRFDEDGTLTSIGEELLRETVRSVDARYPGPDSDAGRDATGECPTGYRFRAVPIDSLDDLTLARTHGLVRCLIYQSCEHEEWATSKALEFLTTFVATRLEPKLPKVRRRWANSSEPKTPWQLGWDAGRRDVLTREALKLEYDISAGRRAMP